ncbi:GNAT family N-acetyltransferase [bacterium]|nr:GNAT family N-acetyltransferase [bacterium]
MKNLGYHTDAIFHRLDGEIIDRGEYHLIRTPSNPTYYWGNYLLFKSEPKEGSFGDWMNIHKNEFGPTPEHIAIGWDSLEKGEFSEFEANGFRLSEDVVLSLREAPNEVQANPDLVARKFTKDSDWQSSVEEQIAGCPAEIPVEDYRIFITDQMNNHRRKQENGHGNYWGAFLNDELVGDMGIFFDQEEKIARFQSVTTVAAYRRKRVCSTLLAQVIKSTFAEEQIDQLVIAAEHGSIAESIYRSFGFRDHGLQFRAFLKPDAF